MSGRILALTIDAPCEWINSNQRAHRMEVARRVKAWRNAAYLAAVNPMRGNGFQRPVRIVCTFHKTRNGRWDVGNLYPTAKAIVDGFVDAGVIPDDSNEWVTGPDMRPGEKADRACVHVHIEETR